MPLNLAKPIADYIAANARLDVSGMMATFTPDAVFIDNGKPFAGLHAIRHLLETEMLPVKAIFTPDTVRVEDGQVVLQGPAHGDFPGSPIRFTYRFTLSGDAIETLEVTI